uniref:BED-type domain-containing protein n=1 Tax=Quercus lobata TaxID=97700 RepID=A0A7N2MYP7_QUELO
MDMASHTRLLLPFSLFLISSVFTSSASHSQFFTCSLKLSQTLTISHSINSKPFPQIQTTAPPNPNSKEQTLAASNAITQSPLRLQRLAPPSLSTPLSIATAGVLTPCTLHGVSQFYTGLKADSSLQVSLSALKCETHTPTVFFKVMETNTNEPSVQTPTATEDDGAIPTQVEDSAATQAEVAAASELPPVPPCQMSMTAPVSGGCSGRKNSVVWDHFEKVKIGEGDTSKTKAICNYCQKSYNADSKSCDISNLLAHVPICPKNPNREDVVRGQKTLAFVPKKDGEDGFHLVSTSFSVEASRKALAEMVIIDELPFRYVEGYGFKKFVSTLQPKLRLKDIPSRQTVARDVIGIYNSEREKLRKSLKGCRVCLTTDTWTSIQNLNYMCMTCHFIDDAWKLHKRILNFCQVEDHKGETIGRKIEMSLREWGIDGIFTLTVDNASSNLTTIKFLQRVTNDWNGVVLGNEYMHIRCCAHILNLIVGEGLKEIDASVAKVHEAVRWNSTYIMLETAEKFEKVFLRMDFEDDGYSSYFRTKEDSGGLGSPCVIDFQNCRTFVTFLRRVFPI